MKVNGRDTKQVSLDAHTVFNRAKHIISTYISANSSGNKSGNSSDQVNNDEDLSLALDTVSRIMLCLKSDEDIDIAIDLYPHLVGLIPYASDKLRFQLCSTLLEFQSLFPT